MEFATSAIVESEVQNGSGYVYPDLNFREQIEALQTPAKFLLLAAYNDFQESFGLPNDCLPKQYRANAAAGGRSFAELDRMVKGTNGKKRKISMFKPSNDGQASRLEQYVAEEYRLSGDEREFEFIEDSDRLERAQRNFIKGLIRAGEIEAEDLL